VLSRLRAVLHTPLLAALLVCSAACGSDDPVAPSGATLTKFAGDEQDGDVGETLFMPLVVLAADARGIPLSGQTVTFAVASGGGSVTSSQVTTNLAGVAQTEFTLGPASGTQTVSATMRGAAPVLFSAIAGGATATQLVVVSGNAQTGTVGAALAAPVVVRASDEFGNPVPGVFVELTPGGGGGTLTPSAGTTNASGQLSATWVLGQVAGAKTLTASSSGLTSATFTATAVAGPASKLTVLSGNEQFGTVGVALPNALTVGVTDSYGNPVGVGTSVVFAVTGGGSVSPATAATDANGRVSATWTMGTRVGANSLSASATGLTAAPATATASVPIRALDHRVVDAEMSLATGKIVTVSANPSRLNVIDPETGAVQSIALTYAPLSVSVAPDGSRAAVGHDGYLSNVNLTTRAVDGTYLVSVVAGDVVLGGNGYAYVFPGSGAQWTNIRSVNMTTGAVAIQTGNSIYGGTVAKLHPSGSYVYGANRNLSPSDFEKYDIRSGPAAYLYDSPYHGDYSFGGNVWAFEDGSRLIARSGNLFRASAVQAEDMTYAGSLSGASGIQWAVHSTAASRVLVVVDGAYFETSPSELRAYDPSALQYMGSVPLPRFNVTGAASTAQYAAEGYFVFFNAAGTRAYTLIRADPQSGLALDWGLAAFDDADIP
jgi:chitinase